MSPFSATATTATAGSIAVGTAQHGQRRQQAGGNFAAKPIRMAGWPSREGTFGPGQVVSPEESGWRTTIEGERDVMADTRRLERLTAQDLMTLWWDDFGWPGDIGALAILDGPALLDGDGRVPIEAIRRRLEPRLQLVPRFRQRLYRPRRGLGWPLWVDAPSFDLANHVRVHPLAAPGDQAQLLAACEQLRRRHLDPSRPLWELWLLPGLPQQRVGLFLRAHHTMADGMAGVAAFGALLDLTADAATPLAGAWAPAPVPSAGELLGDNLRRRVQGLDRALAGLARPRGTLQQAQQAWPAWREFLTEQRAPRTSLNRPIGADRRLALVRSRLEVAKQAAHAHHAKVNDVVLAAVAGGLRQLLASRGEHVEGLVLRASVPISLHHEQPGQARGNNDSGMAVPLPLGEADPVRRLRLIAADTAARKHKAHPQVSSGIFEFALAQRAFCRFMTRQRVVNLSVSNVPGPPVPLYLAGARLLEVFPVVPTIGNITLAVGVLSYAGQLNLTAVADRDGCADVEVFAQGVQAALDELAQSVTVLVAAS
jgi:diacylglycerol O-acyltransferase